MSELLHSVDEMDELIFRAIRKAYGYETEGDQLVDHFMYTIDDAKSYFGIELEKSREDAMYNDQFQYRTED